jgi:hypothetical protein
MNRLFIILTTVISKEEKSMIHVHSFTDTWQMEFNVSKCAIMQTTNKRSKTDFPYKMKGETLQKVDHQPYLGVVLKYNLHIDQTCKKASKVLGFHKRNLKH